MANDNIGEIAWHCHKDSFTAFIRKDRREKFYIYCNQCGIFGAKGRLFQEHIKENGRMYGTPKAEYNGGGEPAKASNHPDSLEIKQEENREAVTEIIPKESETVTPKKPQKVSGLLSGLMRALGDEE